MLKKHPVPLVWRMAMVSVLVFVRASCHNVPTSISPTAVCAQVLAVAVGALGGTAAYAGGSLLSALQKEF